MVESKANVGLLLCAFFLLGIYVHSFGQEFQRVWVAEDLGEDWEVPAPSLLTGPIEAWKRKSRAEHELHANIWTRMFAPDLALRAGQAELAPYGAILSIITIGATKYLGFYQKMFTLLEAAQVVPGTQLASRTH